MNPLGVTPTIYIIGLNRSGTTALMHTFWHHPQTEVFKEPGKYHYELTGEIDFNHFFCPPVWSTTRYRVIKQSLGIYLPELCTLPLYPLGPDRPSFLRQLYTIFIVRRPSQSWNSWLSMTYWLHQQQEPPIWQRWQTVSARHGIEMGWGNEGLFRLAWLYFYESFRYVRHVAPDSFSVVCLEDLVQPTWTRPILEALCARAGMTFEERMLAWDKPFGEPTERLVDGMAGYATAGDPERAHIHRHLIASRRLQATPANPVLAPAEAEWIEQGELGGYYQELRTLSHAQLGLSKPLVP